MDSFIRTTLAIFQKEFLSEMRKREKLNTLLFFGVVIIFLFSVALGADPNLLKTLAPGLLWLIVLFSALLGVEKTFQAEAEEGCLDRLILYSSSHRAVFLGKLLTNFVWILFIQVTILGLMFILFDLSLPEQVPTLLLTLFLGNVGIATLGTFYAALITHTRARQAILPLLLFPMLIPLLLAAVFATGSAFAGDIMGNALLWTKILVLFDVIFLAACFLGIGPLMEA